MSDNIRKEDLVVTPTSGRFTGEFTYRVNHIDAPYHEGIHYSGYDSPDAAAEAHRAHLNSEGNK
jgi:hypothetical protein